MDLDAYGNANNSSHDWGGGAFFGIGQQGQDGTAPVGGMVVLKFCAAIQNNDMVAAYANDDWSQPNDNPAASINTSCRCYSGYLR